MVNRIYILLLICIITASCKEKTPLNKKNETTTFYLIRHAEKDRTNMDDRDPKLKEEGLLRAAKWSLVLQHIKFDAVYSTDYNRTKQTAQPTAEKNGLELTMYDPSNLDGKAFLETNKGKTVLVVGHSNTTPAFINAVLGNEKYPDMADDNNGSLYIVTVSTTGEMSDIVLVVE